MVQRINPVSFTNVFTQNYLKQNPQATAEQVQVALRDELQAQKKNGVRISPKEMSVAQNQVSGAYATYTQSTANVVKELKSSGAVAVYNDYNQADAGKYYDELMNRSKPARQNAHKRSFNDAKSAFASDEFLQKVKAENPEYYAELTAKKPSNNQTKKANNDYMSSREKKRQKLINEQRSKEEHRLFRNTKDTRDARYCTQNGIMRSNGRKAYENVLNNQAKLDANFVDKLVNGSLSGKSAQESAKAFMEAGHTPIKARGKWGWVAAGAAAIVTGVVALASGKKDDKEEKQQINNAA